MNEESTVGRGSDQYMFCGVYCRRSPPLGAATNLVIATQSNRRQGGEGTRLLQGNDMFLLELEMPLNFEPKPGFYLFCLVCGVGWGGGGGPK